jgi:hypothetical protein
MPYQKEQMKRDQTLVTLFLDEINKLNGTDSLPSVSLDVKNGGQVSATNQTDP